MPEAPRANAERPEPSLINTNCPAAYGGAEPRSVGPEFIPDVDKRPTHTSTDKVPSRKDKRVPDEVEAPIPRPAKKRDVKTADKAAVKAHAFRLQAKSFFLTYPKCPLEPWEMVKLYEEKFYKSCGAVVSETHKDGSKHLHCLLKFETK